MTEELPLEKVGAVRPMGSVFPLLGLSWSLGVGGRDRPLLVTAAVVVLCSCLALAQQPMVFHLWTTTHLISSTVCRLTNPMYLMSDQILNCTYFYCLVCGCVFLKFLIVEPPLLKGHLSNQDNF